MQDTRLKMCRRNQLRTVCAPSTSSISHHQSNISRPALTLIELLVVIVILTTLVAGVIPVLSPNNDTRKIRAAARGLQGYIQLVQAKAARTGRPQGIAFKESTLGSGVALEVFGLETPPPFAGFSEDSRVVVVRNNTAYGGGRFPQYNMWPIYRMTLVLADATQTADLLPPRTFQIGDEMIISGNRFLIVETGFNERNQEAFGEQPNFVEFLSRTDSPTNQFDCVWINESGQILPQGLRRYQIYRQPTNSAEAPYQMPSGIAIDMQASVTEGSEAAVREPIDESLFVPTVENVVGIMFSPTGAVSQVLLNGSELNNVSRTVLMIGRAENGGLTGTEWQVSNPSDKDLVEQKREEINWLNPDSRLLSIITSNGRSVVSEPAFVDLTAGGGITTDAGEQIEAAHGFAHEMSTVGGN